METKRVVITGMGVVTSIGKNISEFKESLENGRLGISEIEGLDRYGELTVHVAGQVKDFKPTEMGMDAGSVRRSWTPPYRPLPARWRKNCAKTGCAPSR